MDALAQGVTNRAHRCTKLKTSEFKILTRSHTPGSPPASARVTNIAYRCLQRVALSPHQRFRLVGVRLSNFADPDEATAQAALFE